MKNILVLLSTYNGERYLSDLLSSLFMQKDVQVDILVRDDGSSDNTLTILNKWVTNHKIKLIKGSNIGAKSSFYELINEASGYEYYAFCDQDDVWDNDKLIIAINNLDSTNEKYKLYASNYRLVDSELNIIKDTSKKENIAFNFNEILVKNQANGCTMVLNNNLLNALKSTELSKMDEIPYHDHWTFIVCLALNGYVYYDDLPHISYRQHSGNVIGGRRGFVYKVKRNAIFSDKHIRMRYIKTLYYTYYKSLSEERKHVLQIIINSEFSFNGKMHVITKHMLVAKTKLECLVLYTTILLGKL